MAGSRKGARPKGGGELPKGRVMQPVPLIGAPHFPQPVSGESQRRFEAFTVRGRPFLATTRGPEFIKPTLRSAGLLIKAAIRVGAPSAINVSPIWAEQSTRGEPRSPHSPSSPCSPLAPRSPHTPRSPHMRGASREFSGSLLRLWNEDEEWRSEAVFRSILVKDSFKPGARTLEAKRELGETEDKLLRTVRRILYAKLRRRFRLWHRRAAVIKLLVLLSRPLVRGAMTLLRAGSLRKRRALNHMTNCQLSYGWNSWATMATERREAMELMRRSLSCLVNRKLIMGFQSWLVSNAADAVAQDQRDSMSKSVLHLLHRRLSRGWAGWQAHWHESSRKHESARRCLLFLAKRQLLRGWNSWATMATERREAMELMQRSLSCLVNRKLTAGFQSWLVSNAAEKAAALQSAADEKAALLQVAAQERVVALQVAASERAAAAAQTAAAELERDATLEAATAVQAEAEAEAAALRVALLARAEEAKAAAMENTGVQAALQAAADYKNAALQAAADEKAAALQAC